MAKKEKIKAVVLLSGGLDSGLAAAVVKKLGIDVYAYHFLTLFSDSAKGAGMYAEKIGIPIKIEKAGLEYYNMIKNPKHGYGKHTNPCIDCKIYILKQAKKYADSIGAKFIITGEVLGQRPMSQHLNALTTIEKESGLSGYLLRPLSAKFLEPTIAEKEGWITREKLLNIKGRSRKMQVELARKYKLIKEYFAGGGCLLTNKEYSKKIDDLFEHGIFDERDIELLKYGRHFRIKNTKIIVGRRKSDNDKLLALKKEENLCLEVIGTGSPVTLLIGEKTKEAIKLAAELTARYSDSKETKTKVSYGRKSVMVEKATESTIEKYRI